MDARMAAAMKILAISWAMPPTIYPRALQASRLLAHLSELGWDVTVVCDDPHIKRFRHSEDNEVLIDRWLERSYNSYYRIERVPPGKNLTETNQAYASDYLIANWFTPAIARSLSILENGSYDVLITFAQPWVDHILGLEIVRKHRIPWIAHFSDPWVDSIYFSGMSEDLPVWKELEAKVIATADSLIFTNHWAADLVLGKYPSTTKNKAHILPHAFDRQLHLPLRLRLGRGPLRLVFTGNLFEGRSPLNFLEALRTLSRKVTLKNKLRVDFWGAGKYYQALVEKFRLSGVVTFHGPSTYKDCLKALSQAGVLLLIDSNVDTASPFLPSKLVDYLMFNKPILGLTPNIGASASLLRELDYPVVVPESPAAIEAAISKMLDAWDAGALDVSSQHEKVASEYDVKRVSRALDKLIRGLLAEKLSSPF
jgi:glycosyltransferase involved in cell wall biosynthesis